MRFLGLLAALLIVHLSRGDHENQSGPFGKHHSIKNVPSPFGCNRTLGSASPPSPSCSPTTHITRLDVSSSLYVSNEEIIVTWNSTLSTCEDDFVGIYFVEVPLVSGACAYFDYEFVAVNQTQMSWTMINLRRPLEFRYYSREENCTGNYAFVAKSTTVQPTNINAPEQIHLAFEDSIDRMIVSYVTNSHEYAPQCQYGTDPSSLPTMISGKSETYQGSDMCEEPATIPGPQTYIDPGFLHTILLYDLRPSTTYYYRVGNDLHGWSSIRSFTTRSIVGDVPVNLIAFGDMGAAPVQPGARSTMDRVHARVLTENVTCVLHIGDISYARGIGALWDAFMTQIDPIASRVAYMVGNGNHEYDHLTGGQHDPSGAPGPGGFRPSWGNYGNDSGGECAVPLVRRFHGPSNGNGLFWYSFDVGPVHIISYSTEHDFLPTSPQYHWLEQDLHRFNRSRTPWLVVGSHRPMYSSITREGGDQIKTMLQSILEPLFYRFQVDLNLFAHIHSYERSCPMYGGKCVDDGIVHVLIGMAGHNLDFDTYTGASWSLYHDQQFGYAQIIANRTHLHFLYRHNDDDAVADEFVLQKKTLIG